MKTNSVPLPPQLREPLNNALPDFRYTETPVNADFSDLIQPRQGDIRTINDRQHVFVREEKIPGVFTESWVLVVKAPPPPAWWRTWRRDRKRYFTIEEAGFYGEPRTLWEKSKRAFTAWFRYRSIVPAPYMDYKGERRKMKFAVRLVRVVSGKKPFQRNPVNRNRVRVTIDPHTSGVWKPSHWSGKPATRREALRRAGAASGLLGYIDHEGWRSLGFWFRNRNNESLPEETVQKANHRARWLERNATRLRRLYCGLPPFRPVSGDKWLRYYLLCRFLLGENKRNIQA